MQPKNFCCPTDHNVSSSHHPAGPLLRLIWKHAVEKKLKNATKCFFAVPQILLSHHLHLCLWGICTFAANKDSEGFSMRMILKTKSWDLVLNSGFYQDTFCVWIARCAIFLSFHKRYIDAWNLDWKMTLIVLFWILQSENLVIKDILVTE